jgi:hypothetical protein
MSEQDSKSLYLPAPLRRMKAVKASWKPLLLNWLIPGFGYWVIGEKTRAKTLFGVWMTFLILSWLQLSFGSVNGVKGGVFVPELSPLLWMPTLGAMATLGAGPLYIPFALMFGGAGSEPVRNLTQEYGASYLMVAGLLNWLCCFDIFDRATNRWWWRLPNDEKQAISDENQVKSS